MQKKVIFWGGGTLDLQFLEGPGKVDDTMILCQKLPSLGQIKPPNARSVNWVENFKMISDVERGQIY